MTDHTKTDEGTQPIPVAEIYFLEWDDVNEQHLAQHGLYAAAVRELLWNTHITLSNPERSGRIFLIGRTNGGQVLTVTLDPTRDPTTWRPVTGWLSTEAERKLLEEQTKR